MFEFIIGKRIVAVKAFEMDRRKKRGLEPQFILLDDRQTIIELTEQDYYSYHDCSSMTRLLDTYINKDRWNEINDNADGYYPDANSDYWG